MAEGVRSRRRGCPQSQQRAGEEDREELAEAGAHAFAIGGPPAALKVSEPDLDRKGALPHRCRGLMLCAVGESYPATDAIIYP